MYGLWVIGPGVPPTGLPSLLSVQPIVTVPQVPFLPAPMLLGADAPFVAVTLVTPEVIVMAPQEPPLPLPIPAAHKEPVAVTVPPEMVIEPQVEEFAPPIAAAY